MSTLLEVVGFEGLFPELGHLSELKLALMAIP